MKIDWIIRKKEGIIAKVEEEGGKQYFVSIDNIQSDGEKFTYNYDIINEENKKLIDDASEYDEIVKKCFIDHLRLLNEELNG